MKLRSIALTNVRRFAGRRATLDGIGDGITVLAEPNEFGKSTFFDALHALFFERHRSRARGAASLQPHTGAAPEVAAEIDLPEGRFRIEKRWLGRPAARIMDATGRLIAQEDEAEAWIDRAVSGGLAGPSGLLWVRQGLLGLEPEGSSAAEKSERERLLATRRDLMSSVAGEIDMLTGGRRMDAVLARVAEGLSCLATDRLRPKAKGQWAAAIEEAESLKTREADLAARASALSGALSSRRDAERQRQALEDPDAEAVRQTALAEARAAHAAAAAHAGRVAQARQEVRLAELAATAAARDLAALETQAQRLGEAAARHAAAVEETQRALGLATCARADDETAAAVLEGARAATAALRLRLTAAQRAVLSGKAARDHADLAVRLHKAETFRQREEEARARLAARPFRPEALAAAEEAALTLDRLRARAEARAVTLSFDYDTEARATVAGWAIEVPLRIDRPVEVDLPGLGRMRLDPGERAEDDLPRQTAAAEAALAAALEACAATTLAEARRNLAEAAADRDECSRAAELLASVAPEGMARLRQDLARTAAEAAGAPQDPAEDPDAVAALLDAAELAETAAAAAAEAARRAAAEAGQRLARSEASEAACRAALDAARAEAGDAAEHAARAEAARHAVADTAGRLAAAQDRLGALEASAPDLDTAQARLDRAQSVIDRTARERAELVRRVAELDGFIRSEASLGIEEELEEVRGRLSAARDRARHCEAEVRALVRLRRALEDARTAARDAYFGPVTAELRPLLALLHEGAELRLDDRTLLPAALARSGIDEELEILSGGTREQIAILTRLAFARLLARRGQPVPVILDDALVHTDDARIEAMFTALHRIARDQQILVLTCRQRAFEALGGERALVRIEDVA
ncbi:chromosome segregation protein SMC [Cereibacter sphaeroides]|uniref:AAA family ATPase n=1 Tax=Cereibacter sphaeroides TaxID=1063 RepID=UPI001F40B0FD|nr:chromosome segregation protein SMC [Cereibacter sphaeroides]MCE6953046.1 chromosome segregation protein SMC [Cereibacter sphaeroides]